MTLKPDSACPGRSAARSDALQNRDLHKRRILKVPHQRRSASRCHRVPGRGGPSAKPAGLDTFIFCLTMFMFCSILGVLTSSEATQFWRAERCMAHGSDLRRSVAAASGLKLELAAAAAALREAVRLLAESGIELSR